MPHAQSSRQKKSYNFNELCPKKITIAIEELNQLNRPICFLGGGETVVNVTGSGKGGRNQVREHSQLSPVSNLRRCNRSKKNYRNIIVIGQIIGSGQIDSFMFIDIVSEGQIDALP